MKQTPLYNKHIELDAKLGDFAGFKMPIQYTGIIKEHEAVRNFAGLFDVSHMGEFIISGEEGEAFLNFVTINDVATLKPWQAQYSAMCNEDGGLIDDVLIYRYPDHFMMVVNAGNKEKDLDWLMVHKPKNVDILDMSERTGLVAIQGPKSRDILNRIADINLNNIDFYCFTVGNINGIAATIARTGYTGELGFEIYADYNGIIKIWDAILAIKEGGVVPVGLGCRDTLRMEMKYALYGNDIDEKTNPIEAGLGWITKFNKKSFIGKNALVATKANPTRRLICFEMIDRGIPRKGYPIKLDGNVIGEVTSGTQSPSLKQGIGLGFVKKPFDKIGTNIMVEIRGINLKGIIVQAPLYKEGSANI
ncbi:MAG: glycine cleavage system aminomethyltransferase GcvT [Candidatus Marinimicrobia bacterium]|nr:glycine cleavage system aminomethyltransferase GcvT [Candidatus Neomarinimicrobiota bacterium]MBL7010346.1 glycine cleavage system aminomethyltransferase GcvT [Candidatus Neomarinimicrobiota bacterium]MBL7030026.1 glycine cleavage system aminomethyltransferase GcvT [Candidatus Neomarinimicrobiota bacterium]